MVTRTMYLEQAKQELGEDFSIGMIPSIDNEFYALVESVVKDGSSIGRDVYDSLSDGQRFHFNKHYNHRGDKVQDNHKI